MIQIQEKSFFSLSRIIVNIFVLLLILLSPWWIYSTVSIIFLLYFYYYYEIVIIGFLIDILYGTFIVLGFPLFFTFIFLLLFLAWIILQNRVYQ